MNTRKRRNSLVKRLNIQAFWGIFADDNTEQLSHLSTSELVVNQRNCGDFYSTEYS